MVLATTSLTGFSGETTWPLGQLRLLVTIGDVTHSTKAWMNFMIVKSLSPYNGIIERPGLKAIQAVPSTIHGMLKFPTKEGIVTICSSLLIPAECASIDTSSAIPREKNTRLANLTVPLHPNFPDQEVVDCYPLPKIDWKVESLCGYPFKCFLDAYKGYHQIQLAVADKEKIAFHIRQGVYCYTKMPFGLKNAGATYQRLMDKAFESQMGVKHRGGHNITYRPRTSIKGQILADFLNEMLCNASQGVSVAKTQKKPWTLFTDGSSCVDGLGAGLILTNPDGVEFTYALRFQFAASNNKSEYEALIAGLRIATQMGVKNIQANVDSKLVANQVLGMYVAKEDNMIKYLEIAKGWLADSKPFQSANYRGVRIRKQTPLAKSRQQASHTYANRPLFKRAREGQVPDSSNGYFTKWIEVKVVATITGGQFADNPFKDFCDKLNITQRFASVKHPQFNGLVERAN
nr:reverse transcriptase domain-containing protein [Tanacetum cinerariifolium]